MMEAFRHRGGAGHARRLSRQTAFAEEIARAQDGDDRFFPLP